MGAKKGGKKKGGESKEKKDEAPPPYIPKRELWINIEFKLLNWKFMNFAQRFRTEETHLFTIKKLLQERHGKLDSLKLCFHSFTDSNELNDEMKTLREVGIKGIPVDVNLPEEAAQIPTVQLFYDFKSTNFSDPVILYYNS